MTDVDPLLERVRRALHPDYEVERMLGRGGMGVVYLAEEVALRRKVAVKVLLPEFATARAVEDFTREAQNLARVKSVHVITVFTPPKERDGLFYFVMEYAEQGTLQQRLRTGPLPPAESLRLGSALLAGLEDIHAHGLLHRDLKPSNVFFGPGGGLIGDFGISAESDDVMTTTRALAGTDSYRAEEQRAGKPPDRRTDIRQMGAVLYEACTGVIWSSTEPGSRRTWAGVPRRFRRALRRALRADPAERWADARAFRTAWAAPPVRPGLLLFLAGLLVGVLTLAWVWAGRRAHPPSADLVVLRFPASGVRELGRSIEEPFTRFGRIRTHRTDRASPYPELLPRTGYDSLRTRFYVDGTLLGDTLLEVTVNDSLNMLRRFRVPRKGTDLLTWGRAAADSIVRVYFAKDYPDFHAIAGCGGSNDLQAVAEYLVGEEEFQRDAYAAAAAHFDNALERDPGFILAAWQRALAHRWLRTLSWEELEELRRRSSSCTDTWFHRLLDAQLELDLPTRLARYREVIRLAPRLGVARLLYADELFHRGSLVGIPLDSAVGAMRAAIAVDSTESQAPALDHVIWGALRLGLEPEAKDALKRREALARDRVTRPESEEKERTALLSLAYDFRFQPAWGRLELWLRTWRPDERLLTLLSEHVHLGTAFDIPDAQWRIGRVLQEASDSPVLRGEGFEAMGLARVLEGRPADGLRAFDSAAATTGSADRRLEAAEWRALASTLGLPAFGTAVQAAGIGVLTDLERDPRLGGRALWARAVVAYDQGDSVAARGLATRLLARSDTTAGRAHLLRLLAALDSAGAGRPAAALAVSDPLLAWDPESRMGDPFARAILYLGRARWFELTGRREEALGALRWFQNSDQNGWGVGDLQEAQVDAALSGIGRLRAAPLRARLGESVAACRDLTRLTELWSGAEPGFAALRDSVERLRSGCRER